MKDYMVGELNNTLLSLGLENRVRFYDSDMIKVARDIAPFGKVAAIYTKVSFLGFGNKITDGLKRVGITPLNFIMPEDTVIDVSAVFDIILVPDDVRAILVFDREMVCVASYIATLFKIPVILTVNSINTYGVLPARVPFYWGNNAPTTDYYSVDCAFHVIIDDNALHSGDKAEQYIEILGQLVALIDYNVKLALCGGNDYTFASETIANAIKEINTSFSAENLFLAGLKVNLADLSVGGDIVFNSAENGFKRLTGIMQEQGVTFALIKKLVCLYSLCAEGKDMPFEFPDYNKRTKELAELSKADDGAFLKGFAAQIKALKGKDLNAVKTDLKEDVELLVQSFNDAEQKYIALGGTVDVDFSPFVKGLKLCGDLPNTVNFMTLVRESGFLEFI